MLKDQVRVLAVFSSPQRGTVEGGNCADWNVSLFVCYLGLKVAPTKRVTDRKYSKVVQLY